MIGMPTCQSSPPGPDAYSQFVNSGTWPYHLPDQDLPSQELPNPHPGAKRVVEPEHRGEKRGIVVSQEEVEWD